MSMLCSYPGTGTEETGDAACPMRGAKDAMTSDGTDRIRPGRGKSPLLDLPRLLDPLLRDGALAGAAAAVWHAGEAVALEAAGFSDVGNRTAMQPDSIFQIASMTKPIVAVAALQMIEEGRMALDAPIASWLPEFAAPRVLSDPGGPITRCVAAERPITVGDLLTHRSGITYAFTSTGPIADAYHARLGTPTDTWHSPDSWIAALAELPLRYQPGERMEYGHSFELLGFLLARIDNCPLGDLLHRRITKPLGMGDTGFHVRPADGGRLAHLYSLVDGTLVDVTNAPSSPPLFQSGGGGLYSTAPDYLRFARMLHRGGELDGVRLLRPDSVSMMRQDRLTPTQHRQPFLGTDRWASHGAGMGVMTIQDSAKAPPLGIGGTGAYGWFGAFGTWWQNDPGHDLIAIYMIQDGISLSPGSVARRAGQPVPPARAGLPIFQKAVYHMAACREAGHGQGERSKSRKGEFR